MKFRAGSDTIYDYNVLWNTEKNMNRIVVLESRCKGCLLCAAQCPKRIIRQSERFNAKGYKVVEVADEDKASCTGCASCAMVCPDTAIRVFRTRKSAGKEE